jgi:hypothetical protein
LWIATTDGFFSIVCGYRMIDGVPTKDSSVLMVRARRKDHLENLRLRFPALGEVKTELGTDSRMRLQRRTTSHTMNSCIMFGL